MTNDISAKSDEGLSISFDDAVGQLPGPDGARFMKLYRRHDLDVEIYAPRGHDPQTPHTRDEIYFVAQGEGQFVTGTERRAFRSGDLLYVPAGLEHRFEDFTDDLAVWVIFFGPEQPTRRP